MEKRSLGRGVPVRMAVTGGLAASVAALMLAGATAAAAAPAAAVAVSCSETALDTAISGAASGAVLNLAPGCTFRLHASLPAPGSTSGGPGGALFDGSQGASVSDSTFIGTTSGGDGGAIDHLGGTLTMTRDTVIINVSNSPAGGGGIFKAGAR